MFAWLDRLFGCSHRRTTFPLTPSRKVGFVNSHHGTYVACLDCGQEFAYEWQAMKLGAVQEPVASVACAERSVSRNG